MMNTETLKSKIFELTKNNEIFIEEKDKELKVWACTDDSELYTIYIGVWLEDSHISIRNYTIDFSLRGKGIGSRFYDIFEEYIKSRGFKEIILHCVLTSAEKFWKKKGFKIQDNIWKKAT